MFGVQFAYLKCVSDMCAKVDYERDLASASKSSAAAALQFILLDAVLMEKLCKQAGTLRFEQPPHVLLLEG